MICILNGKTEEVNGVKRDIVETFSVQTMHDGRAARRIIESINKRKLEAPYWIKAREIDECEEISLCMPKYLTYDDVFLLDDRGLQKIMRECDSSTLAKALKGSTQEQQDAIFRNMSKRAAHMLREDMEYMGPIRTSDCNEAKEHILSVLQYLHDNGEVRITIVNGVDTDPLIV